VYDNPHAQFIVSIQEGALDALRGSGFELVMHPCDRLSEDFVPGVGRFIERQKLHGVIFLPPVSEDQALSQALQGGCLPECCRDRSRPMTPSSAAHRCFSRGRG
jgi:LacI family transcriptional regulator